jgi:hypothetical protein
VEQAMLRLELVEHLARIWLLAAPLGGPVALPPEALPALLERRSKAGLGKAAERKPEPVPGEAGSPRPAPKLDPAPSWQPAGPAPAADAWSGGAVEGACGKVYGSADRPVGGSGAGLEAAIRDEIARHLRGA